MTSEEKVLAYRQAVMMANAAARVLAGQDIPELLRAIERADSLGPLIDPTAWINKNKAMDEDRALLEAALPLHRIGKVILERFP